MLSDEWNESANPQAMLSELRSKASARKLRLFGCACCRRIWPLLTVPASRRAVEVAECFAQGKASAEALETAQIEAAEVAANNRDWASADYHARRAAADVARADSYMAARAASLSTAWTFVALPGQQGLLAPSASFWGLMKRGWRRASCLARMASGSTPEDAAQADLLRHMFRHPALPRYSSRSFPRNVVDLAEALDAGNDCAIVLGDALEEAGHLDFAAHFRDRVHPLGCWLVDLVLAKS